MHRIISLLLTLGITALFATDGSKNVKEQAEMLINQLQENKQIRTDYYTQLTLLEAYNQLTPAQRKLADPIIHQEPPGLSNSYVSPSGKFKLHYNKSGIDGVPTTDISGNGVPDYIDSAAVYLDAAWKLQIDELGFDAPKNEDGEEVAQYPIYFRLLTSGLYGETIVGKEINDAVSDNWTSYINLSKNMKNGLYTSGLEALKVTCTHEFNHAIQLSYYFRNEDRFFYEMTSTWLEDLHFPEVNDYFQYLPGLYNGIRRTPLSSQSYPYLYGNGLYVSMLYKKYGSAPIVETWKQMSKARALENLNSALAKQGSSFSQSLNDYGKWLWFSGKNSIAGKFFDDAAHFPTMGVDSLSSYGKLEIEAQQEVEKTTFNYLHIDSLQQKPILAHISAEGTPQIYINYMNKYTTESSAQPLFTSMEIATENHKSEEIVFVVSNAGEQKHEDITLRVLYGADATQSGKPRLGPNPVVAGKDLQLNFFSIPDNATITILDINQHVVRQLKKNNPATQTVSWNLKDSNGHNVSSGIYIFVIKAPGMEKIGKIAVIQ